MEDIFKLVHYIFIFFPFLWHTDYFQVGAASDTKLGYLLVCQPPFVGFFYMNKVGILSCPGFSLFPTKSGMPFEWVGLTCCRTLSLCHFHHVKGCVRLGQRVEGRVWICVPVGGDVIMMDSVYGGMSSHFLQGAEEEMTSLTFQRSLTPAQSHSAPHFRSNVPRAQWGIYGICPSKIRNILVKHTEETCFDLICTQTNTPSFVFLQYFL